MRTIQNINKKVSSARSIRTYSQFAATKHNICQPASSTFIELVALQAWHLSKATVTFVVELQMTCIPLHYHLVTLYMLVYGEFGMKWPSW